MQMLCKQCHHRAPCLWFSATHFVGNFLKHVVLGFIYLYVSCIVVEQRERRVAEPLFGMAKTILENIVSVECTYMSYVAWMLGIYT